MSNKIKCSHILVSKQSEALDILEQIKKGEKFGKLAKELSTDTGSAKKESDIYSMMRPQRCCKYRTLFLVAPQEKVVPFLSLWV